MTASPPDDDAPPMNKALEDCLAMMGDYSPEAREQVFSAWLLLGSEYFAREFGRNACLAKLDNLSHFIKTAQPSPPWID